MNRLEKILTGSTALLAFAFAANTQANAQQALDVVATVEAISCSFGTFDEVEFGEIPTDFSDDIDGLGVIRINCNGAVTGAQVKIAGDSGGGIRSLKKDGTDETDALNYQLYHPDGSGNASATPWGTDTPYTTDLGTSTSINVNGAILGSNTGATAGAAYSDQVTVELAI